MGDTVSLYHDAACAPCTQYVQHLFLHTGIFGLPLKQVQEVVDKAWPCLVESIQRKAEKPLEEKLASLQHHLQKEEDQLNKLDSDYEDLGIRYNDLMEICKAQEWALKAKEKECNNLVTKVHHLKGCFKAFEVQGS
jgi:hypothetical protein